MKNSKVMLRLSSALWNFAEVGYYYLRAIVIILMVPFVVNAQSLQEKLQQCPVIIENGTINYYMPQQNGAYFQLPPARKPYYVNIFTVPWVQPLSKSVKATQTEVIESLKNFTLQTNHSLADKELFLRSLAWCVMLQTSISKQIDTKIIDYSRQLSSDKDVDLKEKANLVLLLVKDYRAL
jgi:hypothetical protein